MMKTVSAAGMALAIAAGSVLGTTVLSHAQDFELRIGPDGVRPIIRDRDRDRYEYRDRCGPREARAAARDFGLRDPWVVRETPRRVVVEGMTRRGPARITFANMDGCPEL